MKTYPQPKTALAVSLFIIGMLLGIGLSFIATWADFESAYYGFPNRAGSLFNGLSCPILMTRDEVGTVAVTIKNPTDRTLFPTVAMRISTSIMPEASNTPTEVAPGESRRLEWKITSENVDLHQFIFVYALVYASYPIPDKENTCGVFVLNAPGNGKTILITLTLLFLFTTGIGVYLLTKIQLPRKKLQPLLFLAGLTVILLCISFSGRWLFAVIALVVTILLILVSVVFWTRD